MDLEIQAIKKVNLELDIQASDKSISHRLAILSLFCEGTSRIKNYLNAQDTINTLQIVENLGLEVQKNQNELILKAPLFIKTPVKVLDCGNSGTTMRLLSGLLSGANLYAVLQGDQYLHKRPMGRVINPLKDIGANIIAREVNENGTTKLLAPITFIPRSQANKIKGFNYHSKISSAQVKSALILAGFFTDTESSFSEISLSRDHTENIVLAFQKEKLLSVDKQIKISPFKNTHFLNSFDIEVANDPSSAFFFAVLASILPNSEIKLKNIYLNKTRIQAFKVLGKMGANISYENIKQGYEIVGDIIVKSANLHSVVVKDNISWLIDEIPALSIAMAVASGKSSVRNSGELRVKESDRISVLLKGLEGFGVEYEEFPDGFDIVGGKIKKGVADSRGDHRIAMSFAIASFMSGGRVENCECINTSFPNFFNIIEKLKNTR